MGYLEEWRKRLEESRIKKENELKGNANFVYSFGMLMFILGGLMSVYEAVMMFITFTTFLDIMNLFVTWLIFLFGLMLIVFSVSLKNVLIRKIPVG